MIGLVIVLVLVLSMTVTAAEINQSHSALDKFNKEVLPGIIKKIREQQMGLSSV